MFPIVLMMCACAQTSVPQPSLCELSVNRENYAGRELVVTGQLLVSKHGSAVIDPLCDKGIPIEWHDSDLPKMRAFDEIAERVQLEPLSVKVRVSGLVKRAPRSEFYDEPYWFLDLTSAQILSQERLVEH